MVSKNSLGKKILTYLVIVIALVAFIFPIYWMFIASFKENSILMRVPPQLYPTFKTIDNYISIITNTKYLNYIKNSFVVAWRWRSLPDTPCPATAIPAGRRS